jgi:hypothetical protein
MAHKKILLPWLKIRTFGKTRGQSEDGDQKIGSPGARKIIEGRPSQNIFSPGSGGAT